MHQVRNKTSAVNPRAKSPERSELRVLLISADAGASSMLRESGMDLRATDDLAAALDLLEEWKPSAILLDLETRHADLEDTDAVRVLKPTAHSVPIIALGSAYDPEQAAHLLRAGAEDYLSKDELTGAKLERSLLFSIERKKVEVLQQANLSYEQLLNSLDGIIWEGDAQTFEFTFVSQHVERLLGYPAERWIVEPTFWQDHIHADDRDWAVSYCAIATVEMRPHVFEYRMLAEDGRVVWLRDVVTVVAENNKAVKLRGVMVDITERKEAEELLKQTEQQYYAVFAATSDGLVINDLDGNVVEVNPAFCNMHGYTREEMIMMHPTQFVHPDSHATLQNFFETVSTGARFHAQAMDVRKDGTAFHIDVHGVRFMYKGTPHILGLVRDVTEEVQAYEMLKAREEQYRAIFEATNDGLAIADLDANVVELNPAWCAMHGYTREEMMQLPPTAYVHPDSLPFLAEYYANVRSGERFSCEAMDIRKDGTAFNVEVHESPIMYNGQLHTLTVLRDITERVQAYELLEQRVKERTQELTTLLEVSNNVASTLELRPLLHSILDELKLVASYRRATVAIGDGRNDDVTVVNSWGDPAIEEPTPGQYIPLEDFGPIAELMRSGVPVIIDDVLSEDRFATIARRNISATFAAYGDQGGETLDERLTLERSLMYVPLMLKEQMVGGLTLRHAEPGYYTERHARLASAIGIQAAIAVENARLYADAQETARKTAALAQTASQVAFGGSLQGTLDILCRHVVDVTGAVAAAVVLRDDMGQDRMEGAYGLPEGYPAALNRVLAAGTKMLMDDAFAGQKPTVMRDMRASIGRNESYAPLHELLTEVQWDTVVAVPMIYRDKAVGMVLSYHLPTRTIGHTEMTFHTVIADQAAVAVENARLLSQAHDKARLEERQRLARELHDSVTQALFSISLIARSAEVLMQRDGKYSEQTMEKMADLRQLTQGALAEMRALIFELRPGALEEEGLLEAIRKHAAAVQGREMLPVEVAHNAEVGLPRLKPAAEEALYRITQEALHNVIKHARATRAKVTIEAEGTQSILLRIMDNGIGFDRERVPAGHMGLGTMRQRAVEMGGEYVVESATGEGTAVTVRIPLKEWQM